jgi:hypothetical protein
MNASKNEQGLELEFITKNFNNLCQYYDDIWLL